MLRTEFNPKNLYVYDTEVITVDNTNKQLNSTKRASATKVEMRLENAQARYRLDGGDATGGGIILNPMETIILENHRDIENFRISRAGGTNATLYVQYRKPIS